MPKHKKHSVRKTKSQKLYKMKGCSKKKYLGGSSKYNNPDTNLAYPANVPTVSNPFLAYIGKGGSSCGGNLAYTGKPNVSNAYPNQGPKGPYPGWLNSQITSGGGYKGGCGCNSGAMQSGGNNGLPYGENLSQMKGIPYPGGVTGNAWNGGNLEGLPGVNGLSSGSNHYKLNTYNNDISRQMKDIGAQAPFFGGKGKNKYKGKKTRKNMKGGDLSNLISQDFVNLGRQFTNSLGNAYNSFNGYQSTVSPLPWKNQLPQTFSYKAMH